MKVVVELSLEEALEYLRLVGKTSVAERVAFFEARGTGKPRRYQTGIGEEDILGVIYDRIQCQLEKKFGRSYVVHRGFRVGNLVTCDEKLAHELSKEPEEVYVIEEVIHSV